MGNLDSKCILCPCGLPNTFCIFIIMFIIFVVLTSAGPQRRQQIAGLWGAGARFKYFNKVYFSG